MALKVLYTNKSTYDKNVLEYLLNNETEEPVIGKHSAGYQTTGGFVLVENSLENLGQVEIILQNTNLNFRDLERLTKGEKLD